MEIGQSSFGDLKVPSIMLPHVSIPPDKPHLPWISVEVRLNRVIPVHPALAGDGFRVAWCVPPVVSSGHV